MHTYYRFNGRIAHPSAKLLLQHLVVEDQSIDIFSTKKVKI
jgi:hypothetical protein